MQIHSNHIKYLYFKKQKVPGYKYSGIAILIFASVGIVINTYSIILLFRKQTCSMFHKMVKVP